MRRRGLESEVFYGAQYYYSVVCGTEQIQLSIRSGAIVSAVARPCQGHLDRSPVPFEDAARPRCRRPEDRDYGGRRQLILAAPRTSSFCTLPRVPPGPSASWLWASSAPQSNFPSSSSPPTGRCAIRRRLPDQRALGPRTCARCCAGALASVTLPFRPPRMSAKSAFPTEMRTNMHVWTEEMNRFHALRNKGNRALFKVSRSQHNTKRVMKLLDDILKEDVEDNGAEEETSFEPLSAHFSVANQSSSNKVLDAIKIVTRGASRSNKRWEEAMNSGVLTEGDEEQQNFI
ncbi:hypothetical protein GQ55_5G468300 [Panicum hallii var. hallii]|uniref:Uncharacterized protein n=1 Tax=Panicum hallii var. hallii TaxID=1504633 RepID=A0A2T7DQR7_9POAL|nr:hypothetical protein GQ55_5G468300 [Panicum hallii var. hallii]